MQGSPHLKARSRSAVYLIMLAFVGAPYNDAKSAPDNLSSKAPPLPPLNAAQNEFTKGAWDNAIPLYKKHLRSNPSDYNAWNQLAASYYHSGQVKLSLETLQKIEKSSPDRSFNFFYQGMCLAVLGSEKDALKYWEYASYWTDEFGARSTFEIASSSYRTGDDFKARQWLMIYLQKFPRGPDATFAKDLLKSLDDGKRLDPVKGFDRPDPELTVYKYHPWSLFKVPHFWKVSVGAYTSDISGYEPSETDTISKRVDNNTSFIVNASIGIGPVRQKNATSFGGYTYKQSWITQPDSIQTWVTNGFSLDSFPLRGDMMERSHQFFGDVRRQFGGNLFLGSYARLEFSRIGSSFFPSPDDSSLKVVTSETDSQLLIPWIGWTWSETQRSMFSLYLRKEIHNQSPEHSNKTFDLLGTTGSPVVSLAFSHAIDFPAYQLQTSFDLFRYSFIFNDYWLDYSRTGAILAADYTIYKKLGANALVGYYQDGYKLPQIKTGSCGASPSKTKDEPDHVACSRSDTGTMIQLGVYYNKSPNLRFDVSYLTVENSSNLKVYATSTSTIQATAVWAFPGTKRVSRMTERFADAAFTKDAEQ